MITQAASPFMISRSIASRSLKGTFVTSSSSASERKSFEKRSSPTFTARPVWP